jgi:CRP/FNR family transcriptional regulator, cyclic AMP receptor protein
MNRSTAANIDLHACGIQLFRDLPPNDLQTLSGLLRRQNFSAGATLMTAEQAGEVVYFIISGTVKVHLEQADGSDVIVAILGAGEVVGEMSALGESCRSASVVTIESSTLLWMDRAAFRQCLAQMPILSYNLACVLAARLRYANEKIQTLATQSVEARVARQLVSFAEQYGQQIEGGVYLNVRLTQSDIAALTGASREHINRVMVSYKERGYLSIDRHHHITICNLPALNKRC